MRVCVRGDIWRSAAKCVGGSDRSHVGDMGGLLCAGATQFTGCAENCTDLLTAGGYTSEFHWGYTKGARGVVSFPSEIQRDVDWGGSCSVSTGWIRAYAVGMTHTM